MRKQKLILWMFPVFLVAFIAYIVTIEIIQDNTWNAVTEGDYDYVVYGEYDYTRRSVSMVRSLRRYTMYVTVVYFTDGRTCVVRGLHDMNFPTGTKLRVSRNENGNYRFEEASNSSSGDGGS